MKTYLHFECTEKKKDREKFGEKRERAKYVKQYNKKREKQKR